jgi:NAD(P)-dependent dehydrogenase (short-subunit alcohol dehydrogenase family)
VPEPRTALVTGASGGLGRAVAAGLHRAGCRVVLAGRDNGRLRALADELGSPGAAVPMDVTDAESVRDACARAGPVDILVNNAGVLLDAGLDPLTARLDLVEATLAVNLLGSWRVSQAVLPGMIERGWGRVVMVSSGTGSFTNGLFPGTPGYTVSKTALNGLTTMLAAHTRGTGVLVNAVNPGRVRTRMMPGAERSPDDGAAGVVTAAVLPDDGPTGVFLRDGEPIGW